MVESALILLLLLIANGAPVVMKVTLRDHLDYPLDGYRLFIDGRPIFGHTKTIRGIFSALLFPPLIALAFGIPAMIGAIVGFFAMLGDLQSSFIKRRLGIASSKMALGLDQIPESILPLLAVKSYLELTWGDISVIMGAFFILELILSYLFFRLYLKPAPID